MYMYKRSNMIHHYIGYTELKPPTVTGRYFHNFNLSRCIYSIQQDEYYKGWG